MYPDLPRNVIARLSYSQNGDSQGQETFSAPSAEKQTGNCDTVFKPPSLSITLSYWD